MTPTSATSSPHFDGPAEFATSLLSARQSGPLMVASTNRANRLAAWCHANHEWIDSLLLTHGAVLLRDFSVPTVAEFEGAARATWGELFSEYGDLPRERAGNEIYESTRYPADAMILFHNESAHHASWPMRIAFHCVTPAAVGGCTPLLDTRVVIRELDPDIVDEFRSKGLMYLRNFSDGIAPSWQQFFHATQRAEVESACRAGGYTFQWRPDGGLRMRKRTVGVARHPVTREEVFFNQVQHHHVACLDAETRDGLRDLFAEEDLPRHVYFGDGSPIPDAMMDEIGRVYEELCSRSPWQAGDVIMLDNMLVAHARDPFEGARRIVVAMAQMTGANELPE